MARNIDKVGYFDPGRNAIHGHESLRIFDRIKTRIPVLTNATQYGPYNTDPNPSKPIIPSGKSRIPVYKYEDSPNIDIKNKMTSKTKEGHENQHLKKKGRLPFDRSEDFAPKLTKRIKLRGLELASVPSEIFGRTDLEVLILSPERESCLDFKLPCVPREIGNLINLRTLVLDTNELQTIPEEIKHLERLETLILGNNFLTDLPNGMTSLVELKSLHLPNNRFADVPSVVCELPNLGFLDMSDNDLVKLPDNIARLANTLHTLLLLMNGIQQLPESFSTLTSLTCLWLGENELKALPEDFGELFRLDWGVRPCSSNIDGNPLVRPPLAVCQKGPYEIRKYFHDLKLNERDIILALRDKRETNEVRKLVPHSTSLKGRVIK